ncbi:MAG: adenylosuccinate lyase [Cyclobacteriaceae bacterium]|jgi:adenylosuccinate lyase
MELNTLTAISPVDGRYRRNTFELAKYFSEFGLIKNRVHVEVEYFIALCKIPLPQLASVNQNVFLDLRKIVSDFSEEDALSIKEVEKTTNHDVKAVEYFIKEKFDLLDLSEFKEFIHFGLTSQDINNTSIPLQMKEAMAGVFLPQLELILSELYGMAKTWKDIPMLAKTHGQPASPSTIGKEILVFHQRLSVQIKALTLIPNSAKFGGATGNMNAHHVAYPEIDWNGFARQFVNDALGLDRSYPTTQIEHYDNLASLFDNLKRINTILIDFSRDVWQYVSMGYFKQKIVKGEIGSSAMPHKVNPIDFENAEGNLGMANAIYDHLSAKLPISRLQRDLTDSTVLRNIGVPLSHGFIALKSLEKGIKKLELNEGPIRKDLDENWAVVSEAIQTILRREGYPKPYEALKDLTRTNQSITEQSIKEFIETLAVSEEVKEELRAITPYNYIGINPFD